MQQPAVTQIFKYSPGLINLVGFPDSTVLRELSSSLGHEVSLNRHLEEGINRRKIPYLIPSFPPEYLEDRQNFFRRLPVDQGRIVRNLFEREFPKSEQARGSVQDFLYFCERVYETIGRARRELKSLKHLPEARTVLTRLGKFDEDLEASLKALKVIDETNTFAIDARTGVIVPLDKMPNGSDDACYRTDRSRGEIDYLDRRMVEVKMKKVALRMIEQGVADFKKRIVDFVRREFDYSSRMDNVRGSFEGLATPIRLYHKYARFMDGYKKRQETRGVLEDEEDWNEPVGEPVELAKVTYPKLARHYDVRNLFPPSLLGGWGDGRIVPINFKTRCGENKFLIAGLHTGGKSFFLENLTLLSIAGQTGLDFFADSLVVPGYNKIFYYRNPENSGYGKGKCEKEVADITAIRKQAKKGDVLFFDEFLDSAEETAAPWLVPGLLEKLGELEAIVFVSTHRNLDYRQLERNGWVIMTPDHKIEEGRVVPARRLKRGVPDKRINRRYMREKFADALE